MNIFVLNNDPYEAANDQCDRHVVKMVLETAQLLCSAFPEGIAPYRRTHFNHPCAVWTRISRANYRWLLEHGFGLAAAYEARFGRVHKSLEVIEWCADNHFELPFEYGTRTYFAQAMPEQYRVANDPVAAYRSYYLGAKAGIAEWRYCDPPDWWVEAQRERGESPVWTPDQSEAARAS